MPLPINTLECDGRRCHKCGKCRDHSARSGARMGAAAGALGTGALAAVSVFLVVVLGPLGATGLIVVMGGAALGTVGGTAVGAGMGAAFGSIGADSREAGICKCRGKHQKMK